MMIFNPDDNPLCGICGAPKDVAHVCPPDALEQFRQRQMDHIARMLDELFGGERCD